jgi:hypothetical protein
LSETKANEFVEWWQCPPEVLPRLDRLIPPPPRPASDPPFFDALYPLLVRPLLRFWRPSRPVMAGGCVPWYFGVDVPPLVPDVLVRLDAEDDPKVPPGWCLTWREGSPDLVLDFVRQQEGEAETLRLYTGHGASYCVIYDPQNRGDGSLRAWENWGGRPQPIDPVWMEQLGIGIRTWEGEYRGIRRSWPRWCDRRGVVLPTGEERTDVTE